MMINIIVTVVVVVVFVRNYQYSAVCDVRFQKNWTFIMTLSVGQLKAVITSHYC